MEQQRDLFDVDFGPGLVSLAAALCVDRETATDAALVDLARVLFDGVGWVQAQAAQVVAELAARRGGPTDEVAAMAVAVEARIAADEGELGPGWRSGREARPRFWEAGVLGARLGLSEWEARRLVATSVDLCGPAGDAADRTDGPVRLPATRQALETGRIGWRHADAMARATARLSEADAQTVESLVLGDRNVRTWQQVRSRAERLAHELCPPDEVPGRAARTVSMREQPDGAIGVSATLDAAGGRVLATAVDAYATPTGADDDRTLGERWADALVEIGRVALDSLDPGSPARHRALSPHLTLLARAAGPADGDEPAPVGQVLLGGGCHLGPVDLPTAVAERLTCHAAVAVAGSEPGRPGVPGEIVERWRRLPGRTLRRRLALRDQGCRFPGCTRPPNRCRPHHVVFWSRGGPTTYDNLLSLCEHHHRTVHDDGWTCRFDGATAVFTDPFGVDHESPPPLAPPRPWSPPPDVGTRILQETTGTRPAALAPPPRRFAPAFADEPPF